MRPENKRILKLIGWTAPCFIIVSILLVPISIPILVSWASRPHRIARQKEAARLIADFHELFNANDSEGICRGVFKCTELPNVRQDLQSLLEETRNRGGAFRSVLTSDIKVSIEPPMVRANIVSLFERGELTEVFDFRESEGPLEIVSYKTVPTK